MKDKTKDSFIERYRIDKLPELVGQDAAIAEIRNFLIQFPKKKALLIHGPAGTGKTSLVLSAAREMSMDILELNASDLRNRQKLEQVLKPASQQISLFKKGKILLMDEVDGVTGSDIGGIPELVRIIVTTQHPLIMTCNDVWQTKLSPVRAKSKIIEMKALDREKIISILKKVAEKEGLKKDSEFFNKIAIKSQGDVRAALNDLQSYASGETISIDSSEKRDVEESIFNILRKIFKERGDFLEIFDTTSLSLDEIFLWIEENIPKEYKNESLAKAYFALSNADLFRGRIYKNQSWRFLVYQNIFQSAGISYSKRMPDQGFTKYERPKRVLKIWLHNQKIQQKKTIAKKYAYLVHCSHKRAMRDFNILKPIMKRPDVQKQMKLSEEEVQYLNA